MLFLCEHILGDNNIWNGTFSNCISLKKIKFDDFKFIGAYTFDNCFKLERIDTESIIEIGAYDFRGCLSLESVYLQNTKKLV